MTGEVIRFVAQHDPSNAGFAERADRCLSLLRAIDSGELLAALPDCPIALANHLTALNLLTMLESEIELLRADLASDQACRARRAGGSVQSEPVVPLSLGLDRLSASADSCDQAPMQRRSAVTRRP